VQAGTCACDCSGVAFEGDACEESVSEVCFTANLMDSYGDGWNGNKLTIANSGEGVIVQELAQSGSSGGCNSGCETTQSFEVCFECGESYSAQVEGGQYPQETSWNIKNGETTVASGSNEDIGNFATPACSPSVPEVCSKGSYVRERRERNRFCYPSLLGANLP
jgi:hypothetical protein